MQNAGHPRNLEFVNPLYKSDNARGRLDRWINSHSTRKDLSLKSAMKSRPDAALALIIPLIAVVDECIFLYVAVVDVSEVAARRPGGEYAPCWNPKQALKRRRPNPISQSIQGEKRLPHRISPTFRLVRA